MGNIALQHNGKFMKEENLQHLISRCEAFLRDTRYAAISIRNHIRRWNSGIAQYLRSKGLDDYSPPLGDEYLCSIQALGIYTEGTVNEYRRSVRMLNDMLLLGHIRRSSKVPVKYDFSGEIGMEMLKFIDSQRRLRRAEKTIVHHQRNLSYFLEYLVQGKALAHPMEITEGDIVSYIGVCSNKVSARYSIRMLMSFWHEHGVVSNDFDEFFRAFKVRRKERIPSFYPSEDVEKIEESVNRNCALGKRDYAIILLASRLGLRASDIATLTFDEIDWENNLIRKKMVKTGNFIELPLLSEVGNAIIDYLKNGRPKSSAVNLFILHRPPYTSLSAYAVCSQINRLIALSGVNVIGKHHGLHSLRHSLASALLKQSTPIETISEVLGHQSCLSTMSYLSIDMESLRQCALEVPLVPDTFYNQKGGVFYERH